VSQTARAAPRAPGQASRRRMTGEPGSENHNVTSLVNKSEQTGKKQIPRLVNVDKALSHILSPGDITGGKSDGAMSQNRKVIFALNMPSLPRTCGSRQ